MRKIFILRAILQLLLIFSVIAVVGLLIMIPVILFSSDWNTPIRIGGNLLEVNSVGAKVVLVMGSIAYILYVYVIFQLKKMIDLFIKRLLFDDEVIKKLNIIGKIFIIVVLLTNIPTLFYSMYFSENIEININYSDSILFNVAIGLFFMILSEVFKIAKNLKEENELTV